jgi:hypothetical protein
MCKKTVLWRLGKYSPVSVDLPSENIEEERPAEAARFADLMRDVIDVETVQTNGNGSPKPEADPKKEETPAPAAAPAASPAAAPAATGPASPRPQLSAAQAKRKTVAEMFRHDEREQPQRPPSTNDPSALEIF